jgi:hypothetical protein
MQLGISLAVAVDLSLLFWVWKPSPLVIFWFYAVTLTALGISINMMSWMVWKINYYNNRREKMLLTGKFYDVTKQFAQVWIPAFATLYFGLAQIWHLPAAEEVVGTAAALDTFLGGVLHLSSKTYDKSDDKYAGTLAIEDHPDGEGSSMRLLDLDPVKLLNRQEVTFKINKQTQDSLAG